MDETHDNMRCVNPERTSAKSSGETRLMDVKAKPLRFVVVSYLPIVRRERLLSWIIRKQVLR